MKVWKQRLEWSDLNHVELPHKAQVIHFAIQGQSPTVWFTFLDKHKDEKLAKRAFGVIATGQDVPDAAMHLFTTIDSAGMVWHLVERMTSIEMTGAWLPFGDAASAAGSLEYLKANSLLDGWCLEDKADDTFGILLPFASMSDSVAAVRHIQRKHAFMGQAVRGDVHLEDKQIVILRREEVPIDPTEMERLFDSLEDDDDDMEDEQ